MSTDQADVFETQPADQTQEPQQPAQPTETQPLEELVGEGKKYKTVEDLVAGFYHSQNHIATLENENQTYRSKVNELEEQTTGNQAVLDALSQQKTPNQSEQTSSNPDEEAVRKLVEQVVEQKSTAQQAAANLKKANEAAYKLYGEDAKTKISEAAASMGVSVDFLRSTAQQSPAAFERLLATNAGQGNQSVTGAGLQPSDVNTGALPKHNGEKNYAYFNNLRKENPRVFKSAAVQKEMMQQRGKLGQKFYD